MVEHPPPCIRVKPRTHNRNGLTANHYYTTFHLFAQELFSKRCRVLVAYAWVWVCCVWIVIHSIFRFLGVRTQYLALSVLGPCPLKSAGDWSDKLVSVVLAALERAFKGTL